MLRFENTILKMANNNITVALSMGCDSLAVLHFLKTKCKKYQVRAFHYDHALRSQNRVMSDAAKSFCKEFDIELISKFRDVDKEKTKKSEADLRELRYSAMIGLGTVVIAHHLDDAVENYLYNCFNGVPEYLPIPLVTNYDDFGMKIIRPFILNKKSDFRNYIKDNDLEKYVVEDSTNKDQSIRRNWLRHSMVPQINEKGYNLQTVVRKKYIKYIKENY